MIETVPTDRPMPEIARAAVDAMHAGVDVEVPVAAWRRPGLTRAINLELAGRGPGAGQWRFVEPPQVAEEGPQAQDILGWGIGRRAATPAPQYAAPAPVDMTSHPAPATRPFVNLGVTASDVPAFMDLADEPTPGPVRAPAQARISPPVGASPRPTPAPAGPASVLAAGPLPQATGMLLAAYAILAHAQPVMAAGLKPAAFGQLTHAVPGQRSSQANALAELADLEGL